MDQKKALFRPWAEKLEPWEKKSLQDMGGTARSCNWCVGAFLVVFSFVFHLDLAFLQTSHLAPDRQLSVVPVVFHPSRCMSLFLLWNNARNPEMLYFIQGRDYDWSAKSLYVCESKTWIKHNPKPAFLFAIFLN